MSLKLFLTRVLLGIGSASLCWGEGVVVGVSGRVEVSWGVEDEELEAAGCMAGETGSGGVTD